MCVPSNSMLDVAHFLSLSYPSTYSWAGWGAEIVSREGLWDEQTEAGAGRESDLSRQGVFIASWPFLRISSNIEQVGTIISVLSLFSLKVPAATYDAAIQANYLSATEGVFTFIHTCMNAYRVYKLIDTPTYHSAIIVIDLIIRNMFGLTDIKDWCACITIKNYLSLILIPKW